MKWAVTVRSHEYKYKDNTSESVSHHVTEWRKHCVLLLHNCGLTACAANDSVSLEDVCVCVCGSLQQTEYIWIYHHGLFVCCSSSFDQQVADRQSVWLQTICWSELKHTLKMKWVCVSVMYVYVSLLFCMMNKWIVSSSRMRVRDCWMWTCNLVSGLYLTDMLRSTLTTI